MQTPLCGKVLNRGPVDAKPHAFVVADNAYKSLRRFGRAQSVLISGESGAGKTETTKHVLGFLSEVAGGESGVEQKVLSANPLLEAFGNAKTLRNNNSSRFGKLMAMSFSDKTFEVVGCATENYLLEKSRVVHQSPMERNYHVFYMLCLAGEPHLNLAAGAEDFAYVNTSGCMAIDGVDDAAEFAGVVSAMRGLEISDMEQDEVFSAVAAILHLGNVSFEAKAGGHSDGSQLAAGSDGDSASARHLFEAARLLQVAQSRAGARHWGASCLVLASSLTEFGWGVAGRGLSFCSAHVHTSQKLSYYSTAVQRSCFRSPPLSLPPFQN